jgi:hypothetical protein
VQVYFVPKSSILSFPKVAAVPVTPEEGVTIAEDFEMVVGKTFFQLSSTQGKGKCDFDQVGEKPHAVFTNKGSFSFPDISTAAKAVAKAVLNDDVVFIAVEHHETEKRYVLIGHEDYDTTVKVKGTTGDKPGSDKGLTFDVECNDYSPLPSYTGSIELEEGTLDCATGIITPHA